MIETIIASVVSLITGAGATVLFFPQIRKSKNLENESRQSEEWAKLYQEERNELLSTQKERDRIIAEKDAKIEALYAKISEQRDCKAELSKENTALQVENVKLCLLKCEVPNCPQRKPPTGY